MYYLKHTTSYSNEALHTLVIAAQSAILCIIIVFILFLFIPLYSVNGQSTTAACTTVTDYNCTTSLNCTSIVCQIPDNATSFPSATASISLQPCDDPSMITFQLQGQNVSYTYVFEESDEVHIGSTTVRATVGRNSTALAFSVSFYMLQIELLYNIVSLSVLDEDIINRTNIYLYVTLEQSHISLCCPDYIGRPLCLLEMNVVLSILIYIAYTHLCCPDYV